MPTQAEFLEAARRFDEAADELSHDATFVTRVWELSPSSVGGVLSASIDGFMARLLTDATAMAEHLRVVAESCRNRARYINDILIGDWLDYNAEFDAYTLDWNRWDAAGQDGEPPQAPESPYSPYWADLSGENLRGSD